MALTPTKIKIFLNAYYVRLSRGQTLEEIDNYFISRKKLTREEADFIHTLIRK